MCDLADPFQVLFLCQEEGAKMNFDLITYTFIVGWLTASVRLATPILLAALGEVVVERSGILNLGLEGIMLVGALIGFVGAYLTGSLWVGLLLAAFSGILMNLLMGFMCITAKVNQVVAGLGITILGSGLSTLLFRLVFGLRTTPPTIQTFRAYPLPLLSDIPVIGQMFFNQNVLVYLALILVVVFWVLIYRTRLGLALRAVGERPEAVDTRGLSVDRLRYTAMVIGGAMAGIGGAYLSLANLGLFWTHMTAGRGFITIAVVIFARWNPVGALFGALVFGGASALQLAFQTLRAPIPSDLLLMLPYVITILVLISVSRRAEFPGAFATPYSRDEE
jgi:general nucleoside transport system permease protein